MTGAVFVGRNLGFLAERRNGGTVQAKPIATTTGIVRANLTDLRDASKAFSPRAIRMSLNAKSLGTCPVCSHPVEMSKAVFSADFQCPHCGAPLKVSLLYWRILGFISVLAGYALAWEIGLYGPRVCGGIPLGFFLLWIPIGLLVSMLLLRIAPYLVRPTLVRRRPFESHLTTLNLSSGPEKSAGAATQTEPETRTWRRS
jgi:hypothetical protein